MATERYEGPISRRGFRTMMHHPGSRPEETAGRGSVHVRCKDTYLLNVVTRSRSPEKGLLRDYDRAVTRRTLTKPVMYELYRHGVLLVASVRGIHESHGVRDHRQAPRHRGRASGHSKRFRARLAKDAEQPSLWPICHSCLSPLFRLPFEDQPRHANLHLRGGGRVKVINAVQTRSHVGLSEPNLPSVLPIERQSARFFSRCVLFGQHRSSIR